MLVEKNMAVNHVIMYMSMVGIPPKGPMDPILSSTRTFECPDKKTVIAINHGDDTLLIKLMGMRKVNLRVDKGPVDVENDKWEHTEVLANSEMYTSYVDRVLQRRAAVQSM